MSEKITREAFFAEVAELGTQAGKGQGSPLAFMAWLARASRDGAIAADDNVAVGSDLRTAVDKFNEYAVKANGRARKQSTGKVRMSEFLQIAKAARMPGINFPATLEAVSTEWTRKQTAKPAIPRKQIEACYIDAARRQKEFPDENLSYGAIELLTRKVTKPGKTLQQEIEAFHTKMEKSYKSPDFPIDDIEEKTNFANMLDACALCFTPTVSEKDALAAATAANADMLKRLAQLEALLAASVLAEPLKLAA